MSLQQPAADGHHNSSKSQPKTRFTIDSILDITLSSRSHADGRAADDVVSFVAPSNSEPASAAYRDDSSSASPLCSAAERHQSDEDRRQTRFDHVDGNLERVVDDADTEQGSGQSSSLFVAAFQRRHQRRVAQLRSFSELFLAQYQQYQRQLRNHFRHHAAQQPRTVNVPRASRPPAAVGDGSSRRDCLDEVRSPWILSDHDSQTPTPTSTSIQPCTSRPVDWSSVNQQPLSLTRPARFVDESSVATRQTRPANVGIYSNNGQHDLYRVVDYSSDRNTTNWTTANCSIGIQLPFSYFSHAHVKCNIKLYNGPKNPESRKTFMDIN